VLAAKNQKPVYVYHEGSWRRYRWSRDLLEVTCLGDVIPGLEDDEWEDSAASHLYSRSSASADIVAVHPPAEDIWTRLEKEIRAAR